MKHTLRAAASRLALAGLTAPLAAGLAMADDRAMDEARAALAAESFAGFDQAEAQFGFIDQYCADCHNFQDWAGGVAFELMEPEMVAADAAIWEDVLLKLRGGLMPPPGDNAHPANAEIEAFTGWMEAYLDHAGASMAMPGRVPLHRLNRKEYANAVRDLLAMDLDPEGLLPADDTHDGFDNIAAALQVSPSFLDQYLSAAHSIAVRAVGNPQARPGSELYLPSAMENVKQTHHVPGLPLGTRGGMLVEHYFPADGQYYVNVADMAGGVYFLGTEFEHTFILTLDGRKVYETTIGGDADMKAIDQIQAPAVEAINSRLRDIPLQATAGVHRVGATFVQRSYAQSEARLDQVTLGGGLDRVPRVYSVEIRGPYEPTGFSETPSRRAIFTCYPNSAAEEAPCARDILSSLARRAYRRPVTDADMSLLMDFYERGHAAGGFEEGVRASLTRILASPSFLYRSEPAPQDIAPGEAFPLTDLQLASRLSFFLWSSLPEAALLSLAEAGRLSNDRTLRRQIERMLADPRAESLASNFAYQWLHLSKLGEIVPEATIFPQVAEHRDLVAFNADVRADMEQEVRLFADAVFRNNAPVTDLLEANYTFLNERLALLYGIHDVKGAQFRRVTLDDSTRRGLLGKGAILMLTSYPDRTAPVLRGAYVLENILGSPPGAPPPNVEALPETPTGQAAMTVRERLALHSSASDSCYSCHALMDPLGFALENFDGAGMWRETDRFAGQIIDASGVLPDGTPVTGPDDLRIALMARKEMFVQNLTGRLMTFALGRPVDHHDMPTVRAIVREAADDDYRFLSIVNAIVNSDQFRMSLAADDAFEADASATVEEAALRQAAPMTGRRDQ